MIDEKLRRLRLEDGSGRDPGAAAAARGAVAAAAEGTTPAAAGTGPAAAAAACTQQEIDKARAPSPLLAAAQCGESLPSCPPPRRPSGLAGATPTSPSPPATKAAGVVPPPSPGAVEVRRAFAELLGGAAPPAGDGSNEARWWDAFADVYVREVRALLAQQPQQLAKPPQQQQQLAKQQQGPLASSSSPPLSALPKERRRQVLADILVHAEISQPHYDASTAGFVADPHRGDASFQRIGQLLAAAKRERGLA